MERSWDPYYKYFKEFDFNLFEIFLHKEFQKEILDLGYLEQNEINQFVLNPGQFCVVTVSYTHLTLPTNREV